MLTASPTLHAATMSGIPSPFMSPISTSIQLLHPVPTEASMTMLVQVSPCRIHVSRPLSLAATTSIRPSRSRSPTATSSTPPTSAPSAMVMLFQRPTGRCR